MQRRMTDISAIPSKNNEELKRLGTLIREIKTELMKADDRSKVLSSMFKLKRTKGWHLRFGIPYNANTTRSSL
ncbi:hypothetical protein V3C99_002000 [Haemonchus contortus]